MVQRLKSGEDIESGKKVYSIDWNGIQVKGDTFEEQNYQKQVVALQN